MNEKQELIQTIIEYLPKLVNGINKAIYYFQDGQENLAMELTVDITEGINWVIKAVDITKDIHKYDIDTNNLNSKLSDIVEAFQNEDFILISDLFQYEIIEILNDINKNISFAN